MGWERSGVLKHQSGNISETHKDRGKFTILRAFRNSSTLFRTVQSPTPRRLGVRNPHPNSNRKLRENTCTCMHIDESSVWKAYSFYRAMHFRDRMSSVCLSVIPSVRLSVTLVICDHTGWKSRKLIARTISQTPSLFVAKRRST